MSQQSTMSRVSKQSFHGINCRGNITNPGNSSCPLVLLKPGVKGCQVVINSLFIGLALTSWEVKAQCVEFKLPPHEYNVAFPQSLQFSGKKQLYGVGNSIEFIKPVPGERSLIAIPQPEAEGNQGPDEHNQRGIGVEQNSKLTPDDTHKFWRLLLTQLSVFAAVFPVGIYISMRANLHRDWRKHIPKGRRLKVPVLGMISILCIPRRIKSRRWQIWEQRQWFMDMKVRHGMGVAYGDTWYWKKIIAERW